MGAELLRKQYILLERNMGTATWHVFTGRGEAGLGKTGKTKVHHRACAQNSGHGELGANITSEQKEEAERDVGDAPKWSRASLLKGWLSFIEYLLTLCQTSW